MPPTRRAYGVRSAQPTVTALRLCRDLIIVPPSHGRYGDLSAGVFEIFRSFTPHVEGLSLDEAFLDVSGLRRHYPTSTDVAIAVRGEIRSRLGLPASVGIASSKFMAKLASEAAKPDGYRHIPRAAELEFLHALPVEALWGVGPATLAGLQRLGVVTIGDLSELPEAAVLGSLGPTGSPPARSRPWHRPSARGAGCRGEIDIGRGDLRPRPGRGGHGDGPTCSRPEIGRPSPSIGSGRAP